ncbi:MAG: hypothetical protein HYW48_10810 [Deltaproteobacteria bacterium]|nr:hypothetical protein [Deltaproteobacteria bacterium]
MRVFVFVFALIALCDCAPKRKARAGTDLAPKQERGILTPELKPESTPSVSELSVGNVELIPTPIGDHTGLTISVDASDATTHMEFYACSNDGSCYPSEDAPHEFWQLRHFIPNVCNPDRTQMETCTIKIRPCFYVSPEETVCNEWVTRAIDLNPNPQTEAEAKIAALLQGIYEERQTYNELGKITKASAQAFANNVEGELPPENAEYMQAVRNLANMDPYMIANQLEQPEFQEAVDAIEEGMTSPAEKEGEGLELAGADDQGAGLSATALAVIAIGGSTVFLGVGAGAAAKVVAVRRAGSKQGKPEGETSPEVGERSPEPEVGRRQARTEHLSELAMSTSRPSHEVAALRTEIKEANGIMKQIEIDFPKLVLDTAKKPLNTSFLETRLAQIKDVNEKFFIEKYLEARVKTEEASGKLKQFEDAATVVQKVYRGGHVRAIAIAIGEVRQLEQEIDALSSKLREAMDLDAQIRALDAELAKLNDEYTGLGEKGETIRDKLDEFDGRNFKARQQRARIDVETTTASMKELSAKRLQYPDGVRSAALRQFFGTGADRAATTMQKVFRGKQARTDFAAALKLRTKAAARIQALWKGTKVRQTFGQLRAERLQRQYAKLQQRLLETDFVAQQTASGVEPTESVVARPAGTERAPIAAQSHRQTASRSRSHAAQLAVMLAAGVIAAAAIGAGATAVAMSLAEDATVRAGDEFMDRMEDVGTAKAISDYNTAFYQEDLRNAVTSGGT